MPRHYPAEVRRQACERMLAGEAVKDLADELGHHDGDPLSLAPPSVDRRRSAPGVKSFEADPLAGGPSAHPRARGRARDGQGGQCDLRGGRGRPKRKFQVVRGLNNLGYSERAACQLVGLGRSTYYKMKFGHPSDREIRRLLLADAIAEIHARSRGTYGMLRVRATLEIEQGLIVNKKLVWKIMRELGLKGLPGPEEGGEEPQEHHRRAEDLVQRSFAATPTQRAVVDRHHRAPDARRKDLLLRGARPLQPQGGRLGHRPALRVSPGHRRHQQGQGQPDRALFDGDPLGPRISQFTSWAFTENVRRLGLISSMGTVGDCYDNAPMESFWGSMQIELLNRQRWRTNLELAVGMADYIENFYNTARRHSALNYLTPIEFEDLHSTHIQQAALS